MTQGIHHVPVRVTGLERSIAFYTELLGLAVRTRDAGTRGALLDDAPKTGSRGRRLVSFRGPDGERLQITGE